MKITNEKSCHVTVCIQFHLYVSFFIVSQNVILKYVNVISPWGKESLNLQFLSPYLTVYCTNYMNLAKIIGINLSYKQIDLK